MYRICIDEVCVRSNVRMSSGRPVSPRTGDARYSVSCMSRAGCSAGMFSASKQCHSSSISGPSTMAKPMRVKIASMRSRTMVSGWRWPSAGRRPGSVTSRASAGRARLPRRGPLFGETRFDFDLERVRQPAERRAVFRRGSRDRFHQRGDDAAFACEVAVAGGLQIPIGGGPRELRLKFVPQPGDRVGGRGEVGHRGLAV